MPPDPHWPTKFHPTVVQSPPGAGYRQAVPASIQDVSQAAKKQSHPQLPASYPSSSPVVGTSRAATDPTLTQLFGRLNLGIQPRSNQTINVVLFGEPGVGKSGVVNLIARKNAARVPSVIPGSVLQSTRYDISMDDDTDVCIFETIGLKEPEISGTDYLVALEKAYEFVRKLSAAGGIHLLLFCIRADRLTETMQSNHRLFSETVFQKKVPVALVVTGLKGEAEMVDWGTRNKALVERYGLITNSHACMTTVTDSSLRQDRNHVESQKRLHELLKTCCLKTPPSLPEPLDWFLRLGTGMQQFIDNRRKPTRGEIIDTLTIRLQLGFQTVHEFLERGDAQPSRRSGDSTTRDVPLARITVTDWEGDYAESSTMPKSRYSNRERWPDDPQRADPVDITRPWNTPDPGERDNERSRQKTTGDSPAVQPRYPHTVVGDKEFRGDDGVRGRETTAGKVKFEPRKAMEAYAKSGSSVSMDDIRRNFPHDLTGHVTINSKYPFASGSYGNVYRGKFTMDGKSTDVAIKVYRVYPQRDQHLDDRMKRFRKEITVWLKLHHENVLQLFGTIRDADIHPDIPAMVCPWIGNGALSGYLERNKDLSVTKRLILIDDVAHGLQYLHSLNVIHGDLSGSNVLVSSDGRACIADFGLSMLLTAVGGSAFARSRQHKGTVRWMAPELLDPQKSHAPDPTTRSDVYSFGGIVLQTLTGNIPYHHLSRDEQVIYAILKGAKPADRPPQKAVTNGRWKFIERCWAVGGGRPSSDDIVEFTTRELTEARSSGGWFKRAQV